MEQWSIGVTGDRALVKIVVIVFTHHSITPLFQYSKFVFWRFYGFRIQVSGHW